MSAIAITGDIRWWQQKSRQARRKEQLPVESYSLNGLSEEVTVKCQCCFHLEFSIFSTIPCFLGHCGFPEKAGRFRSQHHSPLSLTFSEIRKSYTEHPRRASTPWQ